MVTMRRSKYEVDTRKKRRYEAVCFHEGNNITTDFHTPIYKFNT
jgi:hypothetical protein